MIKIILGAIVVVFVFWGVGSRRQQRASRVASVNGEPIEGNVIPVEKLTDVTEVIVTLGKA